MSRPVRTRLSLSLAACLLSAVACGAPDGGEAERRDDGTASDAGAVTAGGGAEALPGEPETIGGDADAGTTRRLVLDAGAVERSGVLEIDVDDDAVSLLLELALEDGEHGIGLARVTAPDGTVVHDTTFASDSWEAVRFASEIVAEPIAGTGDLSLVLPASPRRPLEGGTWRVALETDPPDAAFAHAIAVVGIDPDGAIDTTGTRVLDLHVHVIHPDARYRGADFPDALDTDWRAALERVLAPHALGIGTTTVSVASARETARLAELDDEREIASACRAIRRGGRAARGSSGEGDAPALHVGLVATIAGDLAAYGDDDGASEWPDVPDEGGDPDGEAAPLTGLSPQPGLAFDDESPNACVFVAERPWREGYAPGEAPDEDTVVELLAANLLHELGHFAGLAHPSEVDGETFDLLDDTPRCAEPDAAACGVAGGADNLMFHSGDESTFPWTLTPDQAWVLRRHPLFRPAAP